MQEAERNWVNYAKNRHSDDSILLTVQLERNLFRELDKILRKKNWHGVIAEYLTLKKLESSKRLPDSRN